jgi:hypothetical protein
MRLVFILLLFITLQVKAQDTIRFTDGRVIAVKVAEVGLQEIKFNRFDNLSGPLYVVNKNEIRSIRYTNGAVDTFNTGKPITETPKSETANPESPKTESPAYVDSKPAEVSFQKIEIVRKRLYYQHHGLNEKGLLSVIREHPDPKTRSALLREFGKLNGYKNNRMIGTFLYAGGIAVSVFALGGAFGTGGNNGSAFLIGSAATITGCIVATVNKNKRARKRVEIARIYNGEYAVVN